MTEWLQEQVESQRLAGAGVLIGRRGKVGYFETAGYADKEAKSGDFYGPEQWVGFPDSLPPEDLLRDPHNVQTNWVGCEAAVGDFPV